MSFPTELTSFLKSSVDKYSFTISASIDSSQTTVPISGGTGSITIPCIINLENELIHASGEDGSSLTGCTRGYGGTTASSHDSGTLGWFPLTAEHYNEMLSGVVSSKKYMGLVSSSAPSSPTAFQVYLNSSDGLVYMYSGTSWIIIGFMDTSQSHEDLRGLSDGDPHPVYYLTNELVSAHDGISGGHVTGGDVHDHLDGLGFGRIDNLTDSPTRLDTAPSYAGEVVLDTSTGTLWKGYNPGTGLEWQKVIGAPQTLIAPFDPANLSGACPDGWSRYTSADDRFIKGVTGGSSQSTGGSATHSHTYSSTNIINHSHSISSQSVSLDSHTHDHSYKRGPYGSRDSLWNDDYNGSTSTSNDGGHGHTGSATMNTESTGTSSPTTESANGEPPHELVIWCQKD